jgi:hypothetical protein
MKIIIEQMIMINYLIFLKKVNLLLYWNRIINYLIVESMV